MGLAAVGVLAGVSTPALADSNDLNAYRVSDTAAHQKALAAAGFDVTEGIDRKDDTVTVVGTRSQLAAVKVGAREVVDGKGLGSADASRVGRPKDSAKAEAVNPTADASDAAYKVWTKYDAVPNDGKEQYTETYPRLLAAYPDLVKEKIVGTTSQGRSIIALQVTKGATGNDIPDRPAVLYNALQHAREWLAGETCRRTLEYVLTNYGTSTSAGKIVTPLVNDNELWFVCVNNPDGYEYTFTPGHRLWRKNLRDNDGDGKITVQDGVDPNRNFPRNWGLDDEGSSPDRTTETYRGPSAGSEPETKAMELLFNEIHPVFQKNDHTAAQLLLYPEGFQQDTATADDPIFKALAGDPFVPGIEGFQPELSAGLYITNGDFTDWAYGTEKTLSYTTEGTAAEDPNVSVFEYPDSELQVQQEFKRHLPFIEDLAKSAADPTNPISHLGLTAPDFVVNTFPASYGDPQLVQADVKRTLGDVTLHYKVDGGQEYSVPTTEFEGGKRYEKDDSVYYHRVRGAIAGTSPGDSVEAWFEAAGKASDHFTYAAKVETDHPVLLLSDEDWSGKQPNAAPLSGPTYLSTYESLLTQAGIPYDVYDVSQDRTAPDPLGVLSHYSHVVWYTGDDYVPRAPDAPGGSGIDKLAVDVQNDVRDYLNEGGKLFYTGQNAGRVFAEGYMYNPFQAEEHKTCEADTGSSQCIVAQDDFLQYWLGAGRYVGDAGADADLNPYPVSSFAAPFTGGPYTLAAPTDDVDDHTASLLTTSSLYDPAIYPQFKGFSKVLAYNRPGGSPFEPVTGTHFASAGTADASYKRLLHSADLTGKTNATFTFKISYDTEPDYDYVFAEVHTVGQDDWTTLEDTNGNTSTDTGLSCPATGDGSNWQTIHPFLAHYQTKSADGTTCTSTGTSGSWNAATGNSGGFKTWSLPLPAKYQGKKVEVSISYATDPATEGLGVFVDDAKLTTTQGDVFSTSFEDDLGGFTTPPPPGGGTAVDAPSWMRATSAPFVEGAAVATADTVYTGFGLEKITTPGGQLALLQDVFKQLGAPSKPTVAVPTATPVGVTTDTTPAPTTDTTPTDTTTTPTPPVASQRGLIALTGGHAKLKTVLKRGLKLKVSCPDACTARFTVQVPFKLAKRLKLRSRTIVTRSVALTASSNSVTLKLKPATKRKLKGVKKVTLQVRGTTPGASRSLAVTLK